VGGRHDVRVLEPSPPAVNAPPFFADDPVDGGEVLPIDRAGSRSWAVVAGESGDDGLLGWCGDRWLVRGPLAPLPGGYRATLDSLHAVAEHLVAPCRFAATGKIGLRFTYRGFGTPFFGADRQVRVEDGVLVDGDRRHDLSTIRAAAAFLEVEPGAPADVYQPATALDPDARLTVDAASARALGDWFGLGASLLEQLRADAAEEDAPGRVQIWPEHFDIAVDLGREGARANFGASPGDDAHPEPYLYVGPWGPRAGEFWNEPFGASLSYSAIRAGADPLEFLRRGRELLTQ